ncbi:hypothetical protein V3851_23655 [Paenibacillus sp. M1]|uniref:Uncharacterized protein n=1 Tax=Paenibacillus haidiansis TaxID=1574488 RepID=A0ABU7VY13_9BACL
MEIGRRIYWDKATGNVILDTGERAGFVRESTQEEDYMTFQALAERMPETVGCLQLEYGQFASDFSECNGYRVNPETLELEFSYPNPNESEPEEPTYQVSLSEQVNELKQAIAELTMLIATS